MANIIIPIEDNLTNAPLDLGDFVSKVVGFALIIAAMAAFGYLVLGGIQWITGGGDKGKIEEAKNRITNAIIGLAIVAASWAIFLLIDHFLGLNVANNTSSDDYDPPAASYGNSNCPCGGPSGGCAALNAIGSLTYGSNNCYKCTKNGWIHTDSQCGVISCGPCPS